MGRQMEDIEGMIERIKQGRHRYIKYYTHSAPEGTPIWTYGDGDIVIYEDRSDVYPRYHVYYENGFGGESFEDFQSFHEAWKFAIALAENTIGYDPTLEKWTGRAKEILEARK